MKRKKDLICNIIDNGKSMEVSLSQNYFTIIDVEDFHLISKYSLIVHLKSKNRTAYAIACVYSDEKKRWTKANISRIIMGVIDPKIKVDHIDHDGLNNRKSNLRICTHKQNARNTTSRINSTSKYVGVCKPTGRNKFVAQIRVDNKKYYLGKYQVEEEAAKAYDKAAIEHYGEFANLNFKTL